nr:MAG TPA: Protein of unknown function (DUF2634) [Caudoviricetes sp.]
MPGVYVINTTLYLDPDTWDITLDDKNNLATVTNPYSCAQDVATACSVFQGENIYNVTIGVPYTDKILGFSPGTGAVQTWLETEALRLPYIQQASATVVNDSASRASSGVIVVVDTNGISSTINL